MKPIMRQKARFDTPLLDENGKPIVDDFDRPQTVPVEIKARVQRKMNMIRTSEGKVYQSNIEVDIPSSFVPPVGLNGLFEVPGEGMVTGTVRGFENIPNLSGSRVEYRTVYVDG